MDDYLIAARVVHYASTISLAGLFAFLCLVAAPRTPRSGCAGGCLCSAGRASRWRWCRAGWLWCWRQMSGQPLGLVLPQGVVAIVLTDPVRADLARALCPRRCCWRSAWSPGSAGAAGFGTGPVCCSPAACSAASPGPVTARRRRAGPANLHLGGRHSPSARGRRLARLLDPAGAAVGRSATDRRPQLGGDGAARGPALFGLAAAALRSCSPPASSTPGFSPAPSRPCWAPSTAGCCSPRSRSSRRW